MDKPRRTILGVALGMVRGFYMQIPAVALEPPGEVQIASALGSELPSYWTIDFVEVSASVSDGEEVSPPHRQRLTASAVPKEELYLPAANNGSIGPFAVLITARTTVHRF